MRCYYEKVRVGPFQCNDEGFRIALQAACGEVVRVMGRHIPGDPYVHGVSYGQIFQDAFLITLGSHGVPMSTAVRAFLSAWDQAKEGFFGRRVVQGYSDYYVWKCCALYQEEDRRRTLVVVPEPPVDSVHRFVVLNKPTAWRGPMRELLRPVSDLEFSSEAEPPKTSPPDDEGLSDHLSTRPGHPAATY